VIKGSSAPAEEEDDRELEETKIAWVDVQAGFLKVDYMERSEPRALYFLRN
jgi:hypothetical protein